MRIFRRPVTALALALLLLLAWMLGGPATRIDDSAIRALAAIRADSPRLTQAAVMLTQAGSVYSTIGLGLAAALWLWVRGTGRRALLLAVAIAGERLVADGMKWMIDRPRPAFDVHPVMTHSSAFPSGHSANSMAAFLIVALIAAPRRYRAPAAIAAILASLAVGATRPYLGVHWPSDVIGGWSLGLLAAWLVLRVGERSGVLPVEAQHDIVGGHRPEIGEREAA